MDLAAYVKRQNEGAVLKLKDAAGEPWLKEDGTPVTITLAGTESKRWRKAEMVALEARTAAGKELTVSERRLEGAAMLAAVTLAWDGILGWEDNAEGGQPVAFSTDNAIKLYSDVDFIRLQVDNFSGTRKNFMPAS